MDVESPSQGSDKGDADHPKPAANMALKSSFRHHLPQIPVMNMGLKIAQSKASARQDVTRAQTGNKTSETTQLHVEGTGKIVQISGTGRQEEIFTPPETESSSNSSPGDSKPAKNGSSKDRYSDMTGTPIKLRIRRANRDGELDLSSCVDEAPQNTSIDNSFSDSLPLATTPGQLNKSPNTPLSQKQPGKRGRKKRNSSLPPTPLPKPTKSEDGSPRWVVGDMIWSKVSGHPWWPCMVSCDPFDGIHTKLRPGKLSYRLYHVQFFGDEGERGWVSEHSTMPFEGKRQLEEYFKGMQMKVAPKQRAQYKLEVSARRKRAWDVAWQSAEEALPLSHEERKQKYTYSYELAASPDAGEVNPKSASKKASEEDTGTGRTKTKAKLKKALITARTSRLQGHGPAGSTTPTSEDGVNGESTSKRGRKRKQPQYAESDSEEEDHEASPRRKRKRRDSSSGDVIEGSGKKSQRTGKTDGSFEVFCEKHRESVLSENPDFDDDTLSEYLQQQWDMMDSKQKSRYRSKFVLRPSKSDDEGSPSKDGVVCKRSGRVSKPSAKKMEAEEDKKPTTPKRRLSRISSEEMITPDQVKQEVLDPTPPALEESLLGEATADNISTVEVKSTGESSNVNQETANTTPSTKSEPKRRKSKKGLSAGEKDNSADVTETDSQKTDTPTAQVNKPETVTKRRKSKKLEALADAEHDSDVVSEAPSEIEPLVLLPTDDNYVDLEIAKLSSAGPSKKEAVCQLCESVGELISCEGPCGGTFHADCLDITKAPESGFKCDECSSGVHSCFCCRKSSGDTRRCSAPMCGKFYHEACVKQYTLTKWDAKGFTCPLHSCATCAAENPKSLKPTKGRLFRCVRCPVAYHVGDFCIAAGSIPLAGYNIVCSRHFQPVKTQKHHSHVNVSWCFICNKGGTLLCCESCPAAFHETCLRIQKPEGSWYCRECSLGKRPLYGDVIWIKLGNYRWWPGEICHPKNVPTNIQDKSHQVGEFPVKFLGSNEYFWIHQGRVFLFQEGDKGTKESSTAKGLAKVFARALKQGSKAFRLWKAAKENKAQLEVEKNDKKPAPYKHIKTNIPCGNVVLNKPDLSELPRCECKPTQENPCGPDSECFNRMLMYECHAALCPAGEKCMNQRFQKRQYPESAPFRTSARGWGLKTLVDIKKGEFVNEYVGELVDEEECRRRIKKAHEDNITNFYMLTIDKSRIIDAGPKGNLSRFMNHSCQPNLETQKWTINGEVRVGLFAAVDIPAGSELTFNYNLDCLGNEKTACACGAPICSGFLGVRPKTSAAAANEKRAKEIKKRKKKKPRVDVKKEHEDDCFRCGEGGELVMCDKTACPKAYHLQCLNLAKPPHGKWTCPWHHCDECGKRASQLCSVCPNSFCTDHLEEKVFSAEDGRLICWEHPDLLATLNVTKVDPASIRESTDTNGESGVTDSDSQVSSEDYMEKSGVGDDLAAIQPTDINISRKPSKVQSATKRAKKAEDTDKVTRTGRKVRKRSLDVIDANGIDEKKPKQKTPKPVKKRTLKMSAEESDLSLTSPVRPDGSQSQAEKCESDPPKVQCVNKTPCESAAHIEEVSKDNPRVDAVKDEPMFDDSDEDGFGLVIDIPAV